MSEERKSWVVLALNTFAFTICFACWMMNGVLVTFLVSYDVFSWDKTQIGWLIGLPVLTGSIVRFPLGVLTDRYGGRPVYTLLMLLSAVAMVFISYATSYTSFLLGSLGFGITGGSFAVGIAYTAVWFKKEHQGTALGIFGAGNAGAALTSMCAPLLLNRLTNHGANLEGWRQLPLIYATLLVVTAIIFYLFTYPRKVEDSAGKSLSERLVPLRSSRVHRFGLYYFFVFGGFVALSQWLIPYYVNVYQMTVPMAGMMAAIFSLPSGVIRALGGWMSDRYGARRVMYWVFGTSFASCLLLIVPQMDIYTPGKGVQAVEDGIVSSVSATNIEIKSGERIRNYPLVEVSEQNQSLARSMDTVVVWPKKRFWQEAVVSIGENINRKQLIGRGITHVFFQANVWIFTGLVFVLGIMMGIGKAAVYKHIPEYFPNDVGVVGGVVGVIGGLGGFFSPILFGYLLEITGIWTTCWLFLACLVGVILWWMHCVVQRLMLSEAPTLMCKLEK